MEKMSSGESDVQKNERNPTDNLLPSKPTPRFFEATGPARGYNPRAGSVGSVWGFGPRAGRASKGPLLEVPGIPPVPPWPSLARPKGLARSGGGFRGGVSGGERYGPYGPSP
jgi:hypothetical protein